MSDGTSLIPISDEQAKLGQEIVQAARDAGGYFAGLLGDLPQDLVSLLIGDRVKVWRVERLAKLWENARNRLQEEGIAEPVPPNLKLALPILIAAADENREELQDLWARLLAATMNPNKSRHFRQEFSQALEKFEPIDAKVMNYFGQNGGSVLENEKDQMARALEISVDELLVSQRNLSIIGFVADQSVRAVLMPLGREFLRTVSDFP
jgi:hypothetical protein